MILDKESMFSVDQAVTVSVAGKHVIDLTPVSGDFRDIGIGEPLELFAQITEQAKAAGDATVKIKLETASDSKFSDSKTIFESVAMPIASLNAGKRIVTKVPQGVLKYLRLQYVVEEGPLTAGKFMAGIALTVDAHPIYHAVTN